MTVSEIQKALAALGREPRRSLGQNFLHDQNLAAWIVEQLDLQPGEPWVELGPGLGALTRFAAARSVQGILIEKDGHLADHLRQRFPSLEIVHGDAEEFDLRELFPRGPVKVLGNLPYYISSQILFAYTAAPSPVRRLVFTLQKELAERLSARPRTKAYGALTLLVGLGWEARLARTLPPSVFLPAPKVESAVVVLTPRDDASLPPCDSAGFSRLVKMGFAQRRKLLRNNIGKEVPDWPALCQHLGQPETVRAEELDLAEWVALTNFAAGATHSAHAAQDVHGERFDVVDENDEVIDQASRHEVHERNLRHRAVHIFVFNRRGELFLQRRSRWKDKHPLRWDSSAAGHVDAGQHYDATAARELAEELGIQAPCEHIATLPAQPRTGWEFVHLYRAAHEGPFRIAPAEIAGGAFFTLEQIEHWTTARPEDFADGFLACFERFRAG